MLMKKENPTTIQRCKLSKTCLERGVSVPTIARITMPMCDKPETNKELIAEKLLEIVKSSKTEEEMITRAEALTI